MKAAACRWILAGVVVFYLTTYAVFAFDVTPGKADFSAKAGEACVKKFFVTNTEDSELFVKVELTDAMKIMPEAVNLEGQGEFTLKRDYVLTAFSKVEPDIFELLPGAIKEVDLRIRLPKDAAGEYYGSIFFGNSPPKSEGEMIGLNSRIGMALYVAVEGTEIFKCDIGRFEIISADPLKFKLYIRNSGNVHVRPEGCIILKDRGSAQELKFDLNMIGAPILPNTELDLGIKNSTSKLMPGEYEGSIYMKYGQENILEGNVNFVVSEDGKSQVKG